MQGQLVKWPFHRHADDTATAAAASSSGVASGKDVAARFRARWLSGVGDTPAAELPLLLPVRLAQAAAYVLGVDGAGISVLSEEFRVPLGASDDHASSAERLQFTTGEGPCLSAARTHRPALSTEADMHARWPMFAEQLFTRTPYRGVMSVPLVHADTHIGAVDLYTRDPARLTTISALAAVSVADQIQAALFPHIHTPDPDTGQLRPVWLHGTAPRDRMRVWTAIGMLAAAADVTAPDALALMRGYAYTHDTTLDDLAAHLIDGTLNPASLTP